MCLLVELLCKLQHLYFKVKPLIIMNRKLYLVCRGDFFVVDDEWSDYCKTFWVGFLFGVFFCGLVYFEWGMVLFLFSLSLARWKKSSGFGTEQRKKICNLFLLYFQARIAFLQGERKGQENLKKDLVRRIKMLEYALKQERWVYKFFLFYLT